MIDPPPFSSEALRNEGIPNYIVDTIILSHCHADHDAGTFHKLLSGKET